MFERFTPPTPVDKPACRACRAYAPECLLPAELFDPADLERSGLEPGAPVLVCWLCAHVLTEHEATLETALDAIAACKCCAEDVYPLDVIALWRGPAVPIVVVERAPEPSAHAADYAETPRHVGRASTRWATRRARAAATAARARRQALQPRKPAPAPTEPDQS